MSPFSAPIAEAIWDMKYRFKEADGTPIDGTVEDSWRRIARALAEVEKEPKVWEERFYGALEGFKFLPAGRITAGAGTGGWSIQSVDSMNRAGSVSMAGGPGRSSS